MKKFAKATSMGLLAASILAAAGAAQANIVVGGGATLPEKLYIDILPSGPTKTDFSYTGTGSGAGKSAFFSNSATAFKNESNGLPWAANQSVHFAGSDSAVTLTERDNYNTADTARAAGSKWGRFIQIPAVATAVVVPFKKAGVTALNLTDAEICDVYSRKTTDWTNLTGKTGTASGSIKVVFRSDNSGTTELFSNYLVAACPGYNFAKSNNFTTVVQNALPAGVTVASLVANGTWASGNGTGGVKAAIETNTDALSYLSPDQDYQVNVPSKVASINGFAPTNNYVQDAIALTAPPALLARGNQLNWVPAYAKPASGYPIFGTTNLLVNQCYKDSVVQGKVKAFLTKLYATAPAANFDTNIVGHHFVKLPANWLTAINDTFLAASGSLAIGDASVCNGVGRPLTN